MATDEMKLAVALEARIDKFEKAFKRANKTANDNFQGIERRAKQSSDRLAATMANAGARMNAGLKSFATGLVGGLVAGGIVQTLGRITTGLAGVGDAARRAGLSMKAFQELSFVAKQNRIEVDALTDGMKELSLRADEWIQTGGGSAAESFQRLGYSATELKEKLKDPSALFAEIIGRLKQFDKAAQIRIADELFGGTGGEKFVQLIAQGEEGIRSTIQAAHDLGVVLDDDVITRAEEIDRKFGLVSATISGWVQPKVIDFLNDVLGLMDKIKPLNEQQGSSLDGYLADIGKRRLEIENEIKRLQNGDEKPDDGLFGTSWGASSVTERIDDLKKENEALAENERQIMDVVEARQAAKGTADAAKAWTPPTPPPGGFGSTSKGPKAIPKTPEDAFAQDIQAIKDRIAAMREEQASMGLSFAEQQRRQVSLHLEATALRSVQEAARKKGDTDWRNAKLSPEQVRAIQEVSAAYAAQADRLRLATKAQEDLNDRAQFFGDMATGVFDDLTSGADGLEKALQRIIKALIDALVQAALLGQGPLASLFGGQPSGNNSVGGIVGAIFGLNKTAAASSIAKGEIPQAVENGVANAFKGTVTRAPLPDIGSFASAGVTKTGIPLAQVGVQGLTAKVSAEYADRFQKMFDWLDSKGYKISSLGEGGYSFRNVAGTSKLSRHSFGEAVDINPRQNPWSNTFKTDMPAGVGEYAKSIGLKWGGEWNKPDTMHFQVDKSATAAARALDRLGTSSTSAAEATTKVAQGFGADLSNAGSTLQSFMASTTGGLSSWFQNLMSMFGGSGGALGFMNGISPMATSNILSGVWGLFAGGGQISGPGTGTSDSIPIMASDGEFIVNADATAKNGALLQAINSGRVPHFASGGRVGTAAGGMAAAIGGSQSITFAPQTSITVEGGSKGEVADQALAQKIGKEVDAAMDAKINQFVARQSRSGGMLNRGKFA